MRKLLPGEIRRPSLRDLQALPRAPLVIILDSIRSAYNVGAILRTADAVRVSLVICCGYTPLPSHLSVRKTALGAEETVPWEAIPDAALALSRFEAEGYTLAALEQTTNPTAIEDIGVEHSPLALVVGNEVLGVDQGLLDKCHLALELPQYGAKHSLNVAVAFGIAAYGILGRWQQFS